MVSMKHSAKEERIVLDKPVTNVDVSNMNIA